MKKRRPGVLLTCLCREEDREAMARLLFLHTTTLGIREFLCSCYTLTRTQRTEETQYGPVRVKTAQGWGVKRKKMEYDDLTAVARREGIALSEIERQK